MKILLDLNDEQIAKLIRATDENGLPEVADTIRLYVGDEMPELDQAYRDAVFVEDGILEIDGDAIVSKGFEEASGAYVQCWAWVSDEDAGLKAKECEEK